MNPHIRNVDSCSLFRKNILRLTRCIENSIYGICDPIKLLIRLWLGFSHLREHKFRYNFAEIVNPLCPCSLEIDSTEHYFLRRHVSHNPCKWIKQNKWLISNFKITWACQYSSLEIKNLDNAPCFNMLTTTFKFIKSGQLFEQPLFWTTVFLNHCLFAFSLCLNLCDKVFKF